MCRMDISCPRCRQLSAQRGFAFHLQTVSPLTILFDMTTSGDRLHVSSVQLPEQRVGSLGGGLVGKTGLTSSLFSLKSRRTGITKLA